MKTKATYELKLMMTYHVSIILAMIAEVNNFKYLLTYTIGIGAVFIFLSLRHKKEVDWQWKGIGLKNILIVLYILIFTYAFVLLLHYVQPNNQMIDIEGLSFVEILKGTFTDVSEHLLNSKFVIMYFGLLGITIYNILNTLNLTTEIDVVTD
jgi:amino acid transporter